MYSKPNPHYKSPPKWHPVCVGRKQRIDSCRGEIFSRENRFKHKTSGYFPGKFRRISKTGKCWSEGPIRTAELGIAPIRRRLRRQGTRKLRGKWDPEECWFRKEVRNRTFRLRIYGFGLLSVLCGTRSRQLLNPPSVINLLDWTFRILYFDTSFFAFCLASEKIY